MAKEITGMQAIFNLLMLYYDESSFVVQELILEVYEQVWSKAIIFHVNSFLSQLFLK